MNLWEIAKQANTLEDEAWFDLDAVMHKFTQEVGELNDAIQKYRWIYSKTKYDTLDEVHDEASDVIFNFISMLNRLGVDVNEIESMAESTLNKFIERRKLYSDK